MCAPHIGYCLTFWPNLVEKTELIIGFSKDRYKVFLTDQSFSQLKYQYHSINPNIRISQPMLFRLHDDKVSISSVRFLDELKFEESPNRHNDCYILSGKTNAFPFLQENGENVILKYDYSKTEEKFINLFIEKTYLEHGIKEANNIRKVVQRDYINKLKLGIEFVFNIDIDIILEHLSIEVWSAHRSKIGGDDTFWVYKQISVETQIDDYLESLFNVGKHCIVEESGYTSYFPHPEIVFGKYNEDLLIPERKLLKEKYSKLDHLNWYLKKIKYIEFLESDNVKKWENKIQAIYQELYAISFDIEKLCQKMCIALKETLEDTQISSIGKSHSLTAYLNESISRLQHFKPQMSIIISGYITDEKTEKATAIIEEFIDGLLKDKNLTIVTGNAIGGEHIALNYALKKRISYINNWDRWTMMYKDRKEKRYKEMTEKIDLVCLIGDSEHYLYSNFKRICLDKNIRLIHLFI